MSDGITDAEREGTLRIEKWKKDQITAYLSTVSTAELVDALCKRQGVEQYKTTSPEDKWRIKIIESDLRFADRKARGKGNVIILVVKE